MEAQKRILVVEDDEPVRRALVSQLIEEGYDVREAASGNAAIPIAYGVSLDLILLDLTMPYINGKDVLKFVHGTFPTTKVIVLTASDDSATYDDCMRLGAVDVIFKPYNVEKLLAAIRKVMAE